MHKKTTALKKIWKKSKEKSEKKFLRLKKKSEIYNNRKLSLKIHMKVVDKKAISIFKYHSRNLKFPNLTSLTRKKQQQTIEIKRRKF